MRTLIFLLGFIVAFSALGQQSQSIRGTVTDQESGSPVFGANVVIVDSEPLMGAATDADGRYEINNVPLGRVELGFSAIGYEAAKTTPVLLLQGKEAIINMQMVPAFQNLAVFEVKGSEKRELNNEMTILSARTFDAELTDRFAGSRQDPARMATNFAGVSGANDGRNDIVIRGNSPAGLLWRLEGIDIPSPNHFSSFGSTGGPVSMMNNNVLAKSDFMTSAFPANYGNALSGVFDLTMRNGNDQKHEFMGQIGFNGFEFGAEGPFSDSSRASYMVNFRYSTLEAFQAIGFEFGTGSAVPKYKDLSFKLNFPTDKAGRFILFGLGGNSSIDILGSEADPEDFTDTDIFLDNGSDLYNKTKTGIVGFTHSYFFDENTSYRLTLSAQYSNEFVDFDSLTWGDPNGNGIELLDIDDLYDQENEQTSYKAHLRFKKKFNSRNTVQVGLLADSYDITFFERLFNQGAAGSPDYWRVLKDGDGRAYLMQGYLNWKRRVTEKLTTYVGMHAQRSDLGNALTVGPRLGLRWEADEKNTFTAGYGMHAQMQPLPIYYTRRLDGTMSRNIDLDFSKAQHVVVGYERTLAPDLFMKVETYYQYLYDIPIQPIPSNFSLINFGSDFGTPDEYDLENEGDGRNYGVELTVERAFSKGFYFLTTHSFFKSEYSSSDGLTHPSIFDGGFVSNLLLGREWQLGEKKKYLVLDIKGTLAGGRRTTPIDIDASIAANDDIRFDDQAFEDRFPNYFRADIKLMYRVNGKRSTQEWGIDIQNVSNRQNLYRRYYDSDIQDISEEYQLGLFPIPQYRIYF